MNGEGYGVMDSRSLRRLDLRRIVSKKFGNVHFNGWLVIAIAFTVTGVILIIFSPFALRYMATETTGLNWQRLSNIGQTYDAVSALLVALGLAGVVVTIILQVRELRHSRVQAARDGHNNLIRMALEDPDLLRFWHTGVSGFTLTEDKITMYLNLVVQFWLALWEFDDIDEIELRKICAADLFRAELGRKFWSSFHHGSFETGSRSRRGRMFYQILSEEYEKAIKSPGQPKQNPVCERSQANWNSPAFIVGTAITGALVGGTGVFTVMRARPRNTSD